VSSTTPSNLATGILINSDITITFSEPLNPLTVTNANFILTDGITPVSTTVNPLYAGGLTVTFNPDVDLAYSTNYTATITRGSQMWPVIIW